MIKQKTKPKKRPIKLGALSEEVEILIKRSASDQLINLGFKKELVSKAFAGDFSSVQELSTALLKKFKKKKSALLRFSASAMLVALYRNRKRPPTALLNVLFQQLDVDKFGQKHPIPVDEHKSLSEFIVAFPNASFTVAGKYLGYVYDRPKIHVNTIKNWCRKIGVENLVARINNEDHRICAREVIRKCKDSGLQGYFLRGDSLKRDRELLKTDIYEFLLENRKKRS